ncbi:VanZ family protein [Microbacterium sp.]|uniref:VanZ family protein n=1 Tax=Microbacterium sp. TaxID=51671 RepID=UPI00351D40C9
MLDGWYAKGLPTWIDYSVIERFANVLLYVPLGALLLAVARPHRWWLAVSISIGVSLTIESAQLALGERVPSLVDVTMNSLGAVIGIAFTGFIFELSRPTQRGRDASAEPPHVHADKVPAPPVPSSSRLVT